MRAAASVSAEPSVLAKQSTTTEDGLPRLVPLSQQCRELRQKLCGELLAGGLVWLAAGEPARRNGDCTHAFRADSNFFYVTGVEEPRWGCLLDVDTGR
jgi:hypothetical protein